MRIGTKSLLFGAHQFITHPVCIAIAWFRLYGWSTILWRPMKSGPEHHLVLEIKPWSLSLWLSFLVHDWGYWGLPNMDGPEGSLHPLRSAIAYDKVFPTKKKHLWMAFIAAHSRASAKELPYLDGPSPLAAADKLAIGLTPWWLYVPLTRMTGEIREYQSTPRHASEHGHISDDGRKQPWRTDVAWFKTICHNLNAWAYKDAERIKALSLRIEYE